MKKVITVEWDGSEVSHVSLDPGWREQVTGIAGQVVEQYNSRHSVELAPNPRFGSVEGMSIGELVQLRERLDAYNREVTRMAESGRPQLSAAEEFREEPLAAWYVGNEILHLDVPAEWLAQAPGQAVADKLGNLLRRLPRTGLPTHRDAYMATVKDIEDFWGATSS